MWTRYKKEVFRFRTINILIGFTFLSVLILLFFNCIFSSRELIYSGLELLVIVVGITFTTTYVGNEVNPQFVKQLRMSNQLFKFLLMSFAIIFTFIFAMSIIYFIIFVFLGSIGLLNDNNFLQSDFIVGEAVPRSINWFNGENNMFYFWKSIILEMILVILFSALLSIFVKNKPILTGLVVVIFVYSIFFGNLFMITSFVDFSSIPNEGKFKFVLVSEHQSLKIYVNTFLLPWNQIGLFARESLWIGSDVNLYDFTDYSHLEFWKILKWLPYVYISLMSSLIIYKLNKIS